MFKKHLSALLDRTRVLPGRGRGRMFDPSIRDARIPATDHSTEAVERYYAENTQAYIRGFGEIFQGSRPESSEALIDYLIEAAGLAPGQRVLDAGCGIGGPAIAFARRLDLHIEGLTLAEVQVRKARARATKCDLKGTVNFTKGDFHRLHDLFEEQRFDRILMLESLCHAEDYRTVLEGARKLLAPGGKLYVKDFYAVDYRSQPHRVAAQAADLRKLSAIYKLIVPDLPSTLDIVSEVGFQIEYVRMPQFEPTYVPWARYEAETGRPWSPSSGEPGEVIQGFELLARN